MAAVLRSSEQRVRSWEWRHRLAALFRPARWKEEGVACGPCLLVARSCALNYDRVINTGDISPEAATERVVMALKHPLGLRPPRR